MAIQLALDALKSHPPDDPANVAVLIDAFDEIIWQSTIRQMQ